MAYSQAQDADHLVSLDGGVTFGTLGAPALVDVDVNGVETPREASGWAVKARLAGDLGELTGHLSEEELDAAEAAKEAAAKKKEAGEGSEPESQAKKANKGPRGYLPFALHYQRQDRGFYSGTSILEQGQVKAGGQLRWLVSKADSLRLRHDGHLVEGASVFPACQNLLLAARDLGYGGVLTTWHLPAARELAEILGLPDDVAIPAVIPLGRPQGRHGPVRRRPLSELVFEDAWGQEADWIVEPPGTRHIGRPTP